MKETNNLMEGLLDEITRVVELISEYKSLPRNAGLLAATLMQMDVDIAKKAISNGDLVEMIGSYQALQKHTG